jgi:hypothetical protein
MTTLAGAITVGASFTAVIEIEAVAVPVENAELPPPTVASAVAPAVPLVPSQAR